MTARLVNVAHRFERLPWVWKTCAAPDCRALFPSQLAKRIYCSVPCQARVTYYRRRGRPFVERAERVCANDRCGAVFVPVPSTRRYCCRACGDRHRVRRSYHRHRAQEGAA